MKFPIPLFVAGEQKEGEDISAKFSTDNYEVEILLPQITAEEHKKVLSAPKDIHDMPLSEIISFYAKVGKIWRDRKFPLRIEATKFASKVTGYSEDMIAHTYDMIADMYSKEYMKDILDAQLGDRELLDSWLRVKDVFVHAQPRGRVLHILAGNAPPIAALSMLRGSLTKNTNIIKLPYNDLVTATYLMLTFNMVDAEHPITKTTSVLYWGHESNIGDQFIASADAVCAWGGKDAVEAARKKTSYGTEILEFGPKRSFQFIGKEAFNNLKEVTDKAAHDVALYDQEACHSPQIAFLEGDAEKFAESMAKSLEEESLRLPKGYVPIEKHGHISNERAMAKFYAEKVYAPKDTKWSVIISKNIRRISVQHPLSRTLYIHKVDDLKDALKYIDRTVQTVAVYPENRINELRDEITIRGADRITHLGKMGYFALGAPHDGIYPMARLVRLVKSR
jgi:long-chain-fatty-acyl-CoA reductase